jgi:hypothetical protein
MSWILSRPTAVRSAEPRSETEAPSRQSEDVAAPEVQETNQDVVVPYLVCSSSVSKAQKTAGGDFQVVKSDSKESQQPIGTVLS